MQETVITIQFLKELFAVKPDAALDCAAEVVSDEDRTDKEVENAASFLEAQAAVDRGLRYNLAAVHELDRLFSEWREDINHDPNKMDGYEPLVLTQ